MLGKVFGAVSVVLLSVVPLAVLIGSDRCALGLKRQSCTAQAEITKNKNKNLIVNASPTTPCQSTPQSAESDPQFAASNSPGVIRFQSCPMF